jgi:hypothetical protein
MHSPELLGARLLDEVVPALVSPPGSPSTWFVRADGLVNRRRDEAEELDALVAFIARRFPGAWGLLYERADDLPSPPGPGAFRVRVLARGEVTERLDPFLSPVRPLIED